MPPEKDIGRIADCIDRETKRTDSLISKKTRFIELLKEKRQALITHAVTKGLDPNVKMRDSGVKWIAFERPEYRVMLVADKIQTGFDQPKLVAQYVDKQIANDVEIVQTFSRLNRMAPGKDEVFIIDFVNDPANVRRAFAMYDDGAQIDDVQDFNVVYEVKEALDAQNLYESEDLADFKEARFKTIRDITQAQEPQHKALYAATERPTRVFNQRLKMLRDAIETWESAFEKARSAGDQASMKSADHHRQEYAGQLKALMTFKSGLVLRPSKSEVKQGVFVSR